MKPSKRSLPDQIKANAKRKVKHPPKEELIPLLPTGSMLLNLACGEDPDFGYSKGKITVTVGDSETGKTALALASMAHMAQDPNFNDYAFYFDDVENALEFDIERCFGEALAKRLIIINSNDMDEFQLSIYKLLDIKKPFIYVLDSQDALAGREEEKKVRQKLTKRTKGEKVAGSYGDGKAKDMGMVLRIIKKKIKTSGSLFHMIFQTRDDINPMTFATKTKSGGRAPTFYATHETWLARVKRLKKTVRGVEHIIGSRVKAQVKKNKITGKVRTVEFDIYTDLGVDDVGSVIDYLVQYRHWGKTKEGSIINATDFKQKLTRAKLITYIEKNNKEARLKRIVSRVWLGVEDALRLDRKQKFK